MSLTVAYAKETGHVLGALAVSGPVAAGDLYGAGIPLWVPLPGGGTASLTVPAARLGVAAVDDEPGALAAPRDWGVEAGRTALRPLAPWTGGITAAADGLTVTVSRAVPAAAAVLVVVAGGPPLAGQIAEGERETTLGVRLAPGDHGVLVLVSGWVGRLERVSLAESG
ncbi:hypothetical protein [Phytohabitans houttuyneae]|uniref:Uncharacterized protein n=1 Tax=Phytohabitans houttuyneae TaxID=1076126 RepID=A0A6V8KV40_9ACTN|nr:hypothetical protein [Phytohabitans houttuyneae]GFJ84445.1 hypothetical protein Phou_086250 [Phytohabitans houttuyneae]